MARAKVSAAIIFFIWTFLSSTLDEQPKHNFQSCENFVILLLESMDLVINSETEEVGL